MKCFSLSVLLALTALVTVGTAAPYWQSPLDSNEPGTVALLHLNEYVDGYNNRVWAANSLDPCSQHFWMTDISYIYLKDDDHNVPYPGFGPYMYSAGEWDNSICRNLIPFVDLRYGPMTVEGWLKLQATPTIRTILVRNFFSGRPWSIDVDEDRRILYSHYEQGAASSDARRFVRSKSALPLDEWHHWAVTKTYQPTNDPCLFDFAVNFFIDGNLDASYEWTGPDYGDVGTAWDSTFNRVLTCGYFNDMFPELNASLDEIRISEAIRQCPSCEDGVYLAGDVDRDCYVDMKDFAGLGGSWFGCNKQADGSCSPALTNYVYNRPFDNKIPDTVMLIHFDDYLFGEIDLIPGADSLDIHAVPCGFRDTSHADLADADPVPLDDFGKYMAADANERYGWIKTNYGENEGFPDLRREPLSVEAWIKISGYAADVNHPKVLARHFPSGFAWGIDINSAGKLEYRHYQKDGFKEVSSSSSVPLNAWHHLGVTRTYEDTGDPCNFAYEVKFYIDGVLDSNIAWSGPDYGDANDVNNVFGSPSDRLYIGGIPQAPAPNEPTITGFNGSIDEVRISSAIRLTSFCEAGTFLAADINQDCYVDEFDLLELTKEWLHCNKRSDSRCTCQ